MQLTQLLFPDGQPSDIHVCTDCGCPHKGGRQFQCCGPRFCETCGAETHINHLYCDACQDVRDKEQDREKFEKAEKVSEWNDHIFCAGISHRNGFFESVNELLEWCRDGQRTPPEWAWTCDRNGFVNVTIDDVLNSVADNAYEDFDPLDLDGREALNEAIERFNEINTDQFSLEPNYSRAVLIPAEASI